MNRAAIYVTPWARAAMSDAEWAQLRDRVPLSDSLADETEAQP